MAIKVSDLRIGNIILDNDSIISVGAINGTALHFDGIGWRNNGDNIQPIPLTEEWLVKFGFEHTNGGYRATGSEVVYQIIINHIPIRIWMHCREVWIFENWNRCQLNSVHQLQNLHHSLTGEELQIKEV